MRRRAAAGDRRLLGLGAREEPGRGVLVVRSAATARAIAARRSIASRRARSRIGVAACAHAPRGAAASASAFALIAGGALGNLIDRVRDGAVTDFVRWHVHEHMWPIFNVADAALLVGASCCCSSAPYGVLSRRKSGRRALAVRHEGMRWLVVIVVLGTDAAAATRAMAQRLSDGSRPARAGTTSAADDPRCDAPMTSRSRGRPRDCGPAAPDIVARVVAP